MDYLGIYRRLFDASKLAGIVAQGMQEGIINEGKKVKAIPGEDAYHKAMRQAKTKIDEVVQDMLLASLLPDYAKLICLDVEEESAYPQFFSHNDVTHTLVLDPIDGTLDYLNQKDTYSICSAIMHDHDVKVAIVYFPAREELFGWCEGYGTWHYENMAHACWDNGIALDIQPDAHMPLCIYKNSRLDADIVQSLRGAGFEVIDDQDHHMGCPDAIMECLYGRAAAYFSATRNIRDILIGAILSKMPCGHAYTFDGRDAQWEESGRQKEIVFSIYDEKDIFGRK